MDTPPADYLGVAMSGSGPVYHPAAFNMLTQRVQASGQETHSGPNLASGRARFVGQTGTYDPAIATVDPERDVPSLILDLREALQWQERLPIEARRARVPVAFVMPEHDELWQAAVLPVAEVQAWFRQAPLTDISVQRHSGHSVLVHHIAEAHLLRTLAFMEECRLQRKLTDA